jgi:hypothetical protein
VDRERLNQSALTGARRNSKQKPAPRFGDALTALHRSLPQRRFETTAEQKLPRRL